MSPNTLHLDQKLFGLGKSHATVIKLQQVMNPDSFYDRVLNSFRLLLQKSCVHLGEKDNTANQTNAADTKSCTAD